MDRINSRTPSDMLNITKKIRPCYDIDYIYNNVVNDNGNSISHYKLMCCKCYKLTDIEIDTSTFVEKSPEEKEFIYTGKTMLCSKCLTYTHHAVIDYNIANTIRILNMKGYETIFSCEGHPYLPSYNIVINGFSQPYIYFKGFHLLKNPELLYNLPITWTIEYDDYYNPRQYTPGLAYNAIPKGVIIRSDTENFPENLIDIEWWANYLPFRSSYFKNKMYSSYEEEVLRWMDNK